MLARRPIPEEVERAVLTRPVRVASKSGSEPRNVATTMCFTEKSNDECVGSLTHVPMGTAVICWVVLMSNPLPIRYN